MFTFRVSVFRRILRNHYSALRKPFDYMKQNPCLDVGKQIFWLSRKICSNFLVALTKHFTL